MKITNFEISNDYEFRNGVLEPIKEPAYISMLQTDEDEDVYVSWSRAGYIRQMDLPGDISVWFHSGDGAPYVSIVSQEIGVTCVDVYLPTLGDYFEYMNLTRGHRDALAADLKSFEAERESGTA